MATTVTQAQVETLYTSAEVEQLASYKLAYDNALKSYYAAKDLSDQAQLQGASYNWASQDKNDDYNAKIAITNSRKTIVDETKKALEDYRIYLFEKYEQAYKAQHPEQTVQIAQVKAEAEAQKTVAQGQADAAKLKAMQESEIAVFAQKNKTTLLIAGVVLVLLIASAFIYLKIRNKAK